jgi:Protein of unknown function (DUF3007)
MKPNLIHLCLLLLVTSWVLPSIEAFTARHCLSVQQRTIHCRTHQNLLDVAILTTSKHLSLRMSESPEEVKSGKPFFLDPGTKGGAIFYMFALFAIPYLVYQVLVAAGMDEIQTGIVIGVGFTILSLLLWSSTYLVRVATKDMTYVSRNMD